MYKLRYRFAAGRDSEGWKYQEREIKNKIKLDRDDDDDGLIARRG